ncbi:MAG: hypothetical protein LBG06_03340, partial [Deltaproteobacteria bacterium]|nr:hypothetical protein [Deltaproteobacteria bacterium]
MTIRPAGPGHGQTYPFGQRPLPHRGANGRAPRRTATVRWLKATGGGVLTPAFAVKALFVAAVASATVYLLGQPGADEQLSGEISDTTVWSDRALEVPDPLATEAERMRAETAVVPVFVQDDGVAERIMDGARRVFRAGRGLAEQNPDSLPDALTDEFIADFYAVFHAAGAGDAARSAEAAAPGTGAPGPSGGDLLASAADGAGPAASAGGAVAVPLFLGGFRLPAPAVAESPAGVAWAGAAPVPGRPGGTHPPAAGEDEGPAGDGRDGSPAGDARDGSPAGDAALTVVEDSGTGPDADPGAAAPAAPGHAAAAPPDSPASRASRQAAREPADARARGHRAGPQDGEPAPAAAA